AGEFWYNSNLFDKDTKFTAVLLGSPSTGIITSYNQIKDYPLAEDWKLGGNLKIIKYNDIKSGGIGNDSADQEIPEEYFAALEEYKGLKASNKEMTLPAPTPDDPTNTVQQPVSDLIYAIATDSEGITDEQEQYIRSNLTEEEQEMLATLEDEETREKLDGYRTYEGWSNKLSVDLTYEINQYNEIVTEYAYEELSSQASDYKSDTLSLAWENENIDKQANPSQGHKVVARVKKSLDLLAGNGGRDWDYTKYTFDARKYITAFKDSTLALRMRTQSTTGDEIVDEERSALERFRTGSSTAEVSTYAPFFDMSLLGDLNTMRGYRYYRFYDNNSVLYQSELRFPMENVISYARDGFLAKIVPNVQGTVFAEAGRVSSSFDSDLFLEDMHYSGGIGFKYFFNQDILARVDIAHSEEGTQVRMNIGQTF
ncbi:MAG: BamA/TamA family outer membrane protein, partial [Halanaerobacter sp.]